MRLISLKINLETKDSVRDSRSLFLLQLKHKAKSGEPHFTCYTPCTAASLVDITSELRYTSFYLLLSLSILGSTPVLQE